MVELESITGQAGQALGVSSAQAMNTLLWFAIIFMGTFIIILGGWWLFNYFSYNIRVTIFDGKMKLIDGGKWTKKNKIMEFKLRSRKSLFVIPPEEKFFFLKKNIFPIPSVSKQVHFMKINDVLIPAYINNQEGTTFMPFPFSAFKDGQRIDVLVPLSINQNPQIDTSEINLRPFLAKELLWAEESYKELKGLLEKVAPYFLVFLGLMISLIMIILTVNACSKMVADAMNTAGAIGTQVIR